MPSTSSLMQLGVAGALATEILGRVLTAQTATGTTQVDALALYSPVTVFSTVASGTGARLPLAESPATFVVSNLGANALLLYPATGQTINGAAANTALSVPAGKTVQLWGISATAWVAQVGA